MYGPHRGQARSYSELRRTQNLGTPQIPCGSWLASDGGVSGDDDVECMGPIAGKPAPTVNCGDHKIRVIHTSPVGAGLPAMAVCQAMEMLNVWAASRAGSLLQ